MTKETILNEIKKEYLKKGDINYGVLSSLMTNFKEQKVKKFDIINYKNNGRHAYDETLILSYDKKDKLFMVETMDTESEKNYYKYYKIGNRFIEEIIEHPNNLNIGKRIYNFKEKRFISL